MQTKSFISLFFVVCIFSATASAEEQIVTIGHVGPLS